MRAADPPAPRPRRGAAQRLIALAERDPRRAGLLARAISAGGPAAPQADLPYALGWALLRWERLAEAAPWLRSALERAPGPGSPAGLRARRALLMARQLGGEGAPLQAEWEAHVAACLAAGAIAEAARARCEQAAHLNLLGRARDARLLADRAASLVETHGEPADQARLQHVAGVAAAGCADLEEAEQLLGQALAGFTRLGRRAEVARALFERAWLWQRREQLGRAAADLAAARAMFQRLDLPLRVAMCDRDLGLAARYQGDYGRAIALTAQARERFQELGRPALAAGCEVNLGAVAHVSGLYDLALAAYRQAELDYVASGHRGAALICRRNQAQALCALGQPATAIGLLDEVAREAEALGDGMEAAEARAARGQARRDLGQAAAAADDLGQARLRFLALGNGPAAAECLIDIGWLHLEQGEPQRAEEALGAAAAALADRVAHRWRALYGLGRVAEGAGDPDRALGHYAEAAGLVARLRRRIASEYASSGIFTLARRLHDDALRLAAAADRRELLLELAEGQHALTLQARAASGPGASSPAAEARRAAAHERLRAAAGPGADSAHLPQALAAYIAALLQEPPFAPPAELPGRRLSLAALREGLARRYGADWTLFVPIRAGDALLLAGVTADGVELSRAALDPALRDLLERACLPENRLHTYRDLARLRSPALPAWATLRALADRLLPGWLRARLHPAHRLLIAPRGGLHGLPWAALRLPDAWLAERALIEQPLALGPGRAHGPPAPHGPALLVGCADFQGRAAPIPLALETLDLAERGWPGPARRLAGPAATRAGLLALSRSGELEQFRLIHIASHAQLGAAGGLLAHVKLADGDLPLDELRRLRLREATVVLAACEGGAAELLPGDEALGLGPALLAAGATAVVASLWPIYDRGILALLEPLYAALAGGADPALALALAQRALIAHPDASLRSPFIWGGFAVAGAGIAA